MSKELFIKALAILFVVAAAGVVMSYFNSESPEPVDVSAVDWSTCEVADSVVINQHERAAWVRCEHAIIGDYRKGNFQFPTDTIGRQGYDHDFFGDPLGVQIVSKGWVLNSETLTSVRENMTLYDRMTSQYALRNEHEDNVIYGHGYRTLLLHGDYKHSVLCISRTTSIDYCDSVLVDVFGGERTTLDEFTDEIPFTDQVQ